MRTWVHSLLADKSGAAPSEWLIFTLLADLILCILILVLILHNKYPTISEVAGGFTAIHAIGGGAQRVNNG